MNSGTLARLGRRLEAIARQASVSPDDPRILPVDEAVIADLLRHPGSSIGEITRRTGFAQSHVSSTLARLRHKGQVEITTDPVDGRRRLARVSDSTSKVIAARGERPANDAIYAGLGIDDEQTRGRVVELLEELASLLLPETTPGVSDARES